MPEQPAPSIFEDMTKAEEFGSDCIEFHVLLE